MGSRNRRIEKPVVVAVEGLDYFHLLRDGLFGPNSEFAEQIQLWDFVDNQHGLTGGLEILIMESAFRKGEVRTIGVIRDAETDRAATEASLKESLVDVGLSVPVSQMTIAPGRPNVGYLIIPHDKPSGCLEHACLESSTLRDEHVECARTFYGTVEPFHNPRLNDNYQAKVKVHALIAGSGKNPAMTLGQSAAAQLWDFQRGSLLAMKEFLRLMRDAPEVQ